LPTAQRGTRIVELVTAAAARSVAPTHVGQLTTEATMQTAQRDLDDPVPERTREAP